MKSVYAMLAMGWLAVGSVHAGTTIEIQTIEIGTKIGGSVNFEPGSRTVTEIGLPGSNSSIYASFFVGRRAVVQHELAFHQTIANGRRVANLAAILDAGYSFGGAERSAAYITVNGGARWYRTRYWGSNAIVGAGIRLGYRVPVSLGCALGVEGGYRRWFTESGYNEVAAAFRIGALLLSPKL